MPKRSRPYRDCLMEDLRDHNKALSYARAAYEEGPEDFDHAIRNIYAAGRAAGEHPPLHEVARDIASELRDRGFMAPGEYSLMVQLVLVRLVKAFAPDTLDKAPAASGGGEG